MKIIEEMIEELAQHRTENADIEELMNLYRDRQKAMINSWPEEEIITAYKIEILQED